MAASVPRLYVQPGSHPCAAVEVALRMKAIEFERVDLLPLSQVLVGLGPIKMPAYLDRQEVVTRVAPNRLELSGQDRWAEPLDSDFTRVLAQNLSSDLGTQRITFYPWYNTTLVDYQVKINVYRFESDKDGKVDLTAHWQVLSGTGKLLIVRDSSYTETAKPGDAADSAAAMSRALGRLSRDIASAIEATPGNTAAGSA